MLFRSVLAIFVPNLGMAGGAASVLVTVAIIGILAAVAIPAYQEKQGARLAICPESIGSVSDGTIGKLVKTSAANKNSPC